MLYTTGALEKNFDEKGRCRRESYTPKYKCVLLPCYRRWSILSRGVLCRFLIQILRTYGRTDSRPKSLKYKKKKKRNLKLYGFEVLPRQRKPIIMYKTRYNLKCIKSVITFGLDLNKN